MPEDNTETATPGVETHRVAAQKLQREYRTKVKAPPTPLWMPRGMTTDKKIAYRRHGVHEA
jgi:hypothetical protein